jgi:Uma2 family endonuclease
MWEVGIFDTKERIELIQGAFYQKSTKTPIFCYCISQLSQFFILQYPNRFQTRIYNPLRFDNFTELLPDIALVEPKGDYYKDPHPTPDVVHIIIEVFISDPSLVANLKYPIYARANISEVWIVNLEETCIEIYSKPENGSYTQQIIYKPQDTINTNLISNLKVAQILG